MYLEITAFDGASLSGTGASPSRTMISMKETATVISRIGELENGAKFDADGAADSDTVLGQVTARYQLLVQSGITGMRGLNNQLTHFVSRRGHLGTLTGIARSDATDVTYQCTARCMDAIEEEITIDNAPGGGGAAYAYVTMVWDKKSEWQEVV
jgi:hypothetical protein